MCFGAGGSAGFYRGFYIAAIATLIITFSIVGALAALVIKIERKREANL
ncbi:MAG: hypothetical protein ACYCPQ_01255 [Elusimicrobiota bacterium]